MYISLIFLYDYVMHYTFADLGSNKVSSSSSSSHLRHLNDDVVLSSAVVDFKVAC